MMLGDVGKFYESFNYIKVVNSASKNEEVGVAVSNQKIVFQEDDIIETYRETRIKKQINWNPPGF